MLLTLFFSLLYIFIAFGEAYFILMILMEKGYLTLFEAVMAIIASLLIFPVFLFIISFCIIEGFDSVVWRKKQ